VRPIGLENASRPGTEAQQLPYLKSTGIAELLVLKQHLLRYERVDIAHIENVMQGEKRSRTHRALDRTEDITVSETETVRERETDLQTAERFELQRETNSIVKEDYQAGFQLSLSGRYGPSVEFSSNTQLDVHSAHEQTTRTATNYAKDIVSRSLERVTERVREQHQRNVMREIEETNLHELANKSKAHVIGCYQFVEKVYESQVFNYGQRAIFDFMIPEPASYVWFLEQSPATNLNLPDPPPQLAALVPNARYVNPCNYLQLAAQFGATGIAGPPPVLLTSSASVKSGDGSVSEEGEPRSIVDKDVPVPQGYKPFSATVRPLAMTDSALTIGITTGASQSVWTPRHAPETTSVGSGNTMAATEIQLYLGADSHARNQQGAVSVQALAYETATFGLTIDIVFLRTQEAYEAWQAKNYDALAEAYRNSVQKYEQDVAELKAQAQAQADRNKAAAPFGTPPAQSRRTVMEELKKQCSSVITRQWFDQAGSVNDSAPPTFDFDLAQQQGDFARFFEQAFEWDQMQYVFYPYYWARQKTWADRFRRQDIDPDFQEFLRAGAARVVAPVRPGFEVAVMHYLETFQIWNGQGDPPGVHDPLYVPIITELEERTGAPQGEIPVGDPWLTHVPTPLAILRTDAKLPAWKRPDPQGWEWQEEV
jgi:hypothetical protein